MEIRQAYRAKVRNTAEKTMKLAGPHRNQEVKYIGIYGQNIFIGVKRK